LNVPCDWEFYLTEDRVVKQEDGAMHICDTLFLVVHGRECDAQGGVIGSTSIQTRGGTSCSVICPFINDCWLQLRTQTQWYTEQ
jgi:hypothetical protein